MITEEHRNELLKNWEPEKNKIPFYDDYHYLGTHDVHLNRVFAFDKTFMDCYKKTFCVTRNNPDKCYTMFQMSKMIKDVEGIVIEVGVFKGGTAKFLTEIMPYRKFHFYDTFCGVPTIPNENDKDWVFKEFGSVCFNEVVEYVGNEDKVTFHKGIFPDTFTEQDEKIAFVHLDMDTYVGIKAGLELLYPRVQKGGFIFIDDWHSNFTGVDIAVDEFMKDKPENILQFALQQCFIRKE